MAGSKSIMIDPGTPMGSGGGEMMNCGAEKHEAMTRPLAIYLLVDQSASMTDAVDLWAPVTSALKTFIADPESAGIEIALGYFPATSTDLMVKCDPASYVTPSVEVGLLPENAAPIQASLDSKMFPLNQGMIPQERLSTPTAPAVAGSLEYFAGWLAQHPDHTGVLVLATDGDPAGCGETGLGGPPIGGGMGFGTPEELQDAIDAIGAAASGTPAIKTYVIGIGQLMEKLDQLAIAGDTGLGAFIVDAAGGDSTQEEFLQAMKDIRGSALPCSFDIPLPTVGVLDHSKVNVDFQTDADAEKVPFFKVDDAAACGDSATAWYYDDPLHPRSVELCPAACEAVRAVTTSNVSISLGCETRVL